MSSDNSQAIFDALNNSTLAIWPFCDLQTTCNLQFASVEYFPSLSGNVIYGGIFVLLALVQLVQGIRYRTWSFLFLMLLGLILEVLGYVGRLGLHYNPFLKNPFLLYLITLTIAPTIFCACIYITTSRLISLYDPRHQYTHLAPRTYTLLFLFFDLVSLTLQITGSVFTETSIAKLEWNGVKVMLAGIAFQVLSLLIFITICVEFAIRVHKHKTAAARSWQEGNGRGGPMKLTGFLCALTLATMAILIRSVFRVVEMNGGFNSWVANQEILFMIFEGGAMLVACIALTIYHPGRVLFDHWAVGLSGRTVTNSNTGMGIAKKPFVAGDGEDNETEHFIANQGPMAGFEMSHVAAGGGQYVKVADPNAPRYIKDTATTDPNTDKFEPVRIQSQPGRFEPVRTEYGGAGAVAGSGGEMASYGEGDIAEYGATGRRS